MVALLSLAIHQLKASSQILHFFRKLESGIGPATAEYLSTVVIGAYRCAVIRVE